MDSRRTKPGYYTIGTRGSALALRQTQEVVSELEQRYPQHHFSVLPIKIIETEGDRLSTVSLASLGGRGVFVKELEVALLRGEIDLAVHSLKDMPSQMEEGLSLAAIGPRQDVRDALVTRHQLPLAQLPHGAKVATGSPRRAAQLKAFRPDFRIQDIRGNIDTRLRKAAEDDLDGVILAAAGLLRMGWEDRISEYLPMEVSLPAVGQGALAVEVREDDAELIEILRPIDHYPTRQAVTAERAFLKGLGGGCQVPIAAYAQVSDGQLEITGLVASVTGTPLIRESMTGSATDPEGLGQALAERVLALGGREILAEGSP